MAGFLIKDTTREEREQIVADSLGNIDAYCDGCMCGITEMYQDLGQCHHSVLMPTAQYWQNIIVWSSMRDMFGMRIWMDGSKHMVTTLIISMWQSWKSHVNMDIQLVGLHYINK